MNNLSKYELLQHRHLSLLRALEQHGVKAKCDERARGLLHPWTRPLPVARQSSTTG